MTFRKKLWLGLGALALLSPAGVILPEMFKAGDAWGEWGEDTLQQMLGYVPAGLKRVGSLWGAPIADYGTGNGSMASQSGWYAASAFIGVALTALAVYCISKLMLRRAEGAAGKEEEC